MNINNLELNHQIAAPTSDVLNEIYTKTQIISITSDTNSISEVYYSLDEGAFFKKYYGPFAINQSTKLKFVSVNDQSRSEIIELDIKICKTEPLIKGSVAIVGGAEHCKEIHQKVIDLVGGKDQAKIAFIPSSSSDAYSSGIDRVTRFSKLCDLNIDLSKVPEKNGKKDYSDITDLSNFWILPVATMDDQYTTDHAIDDPDSLLANESSFPNIDESKWINNGFNKEIAEKLRDGGYNIIFLTGGNQARYMKCLVYPDGSDGPVLSIIKEIYLERGGVILGTSAGGAVLSHVMMQGGSSYGALTQGIIHQDVDLTNYKENYIPHTNELDARLWLGKGFGILPLTIVSDTHFVARGRIGRLISAGCFIKESFNRAVIGIGSDEDTAVIIYNNNTGEIVGALGAIIIDFSQSEIVEGKSHSGKEYVKNIILHYLEPRDKFGFDETNGNITLLSVAESKQLVNEPVFNDGQNFFFEHDIFGKNKIKRLLYQYLGINAATESIGFAFTDNLEDSYDEIPSRDLTTNGSTLLYLKKGINTKIFKGQVSYSWWGPGDKDFPNLRKEIEENRFSVSGIICDILPLSIINVPDISDATHIPLKSDYLLDGYLENEWYDLFDRKKNYYFGAILIPDKDDYYEARTFFYDYAYNDYDRNGYYSPPKLKPVNEKENFKDYEITEIDKAQGANVFIDNNFIGKTDCFGKLCFQITPENSFIKFVYEGYREYKVEMDLKALKKKSASIIFETK